MQWNSWITLMKDCSPRVLPSFEYPLNSLLLTFITAVCSEIPCSSVSRFMETSYLTFIAIQLTGCHVLPDLGAGNLEKDYKQFCIKTSLLSSLSLSLSLSFSLSLSLSIYIYIYIYIIT